MVEADADPGLLAEPGRLASALAVVLVSGVVKGAIGFGFPTLAVPALSLLVGTRVAVILISLPTLLANTLLLARRPLDPAAVRRFVPILATLVPATVLGSVLLATINARALTLVVGLVTVAVGLVSLARVDLSVPPALEPRLSLALGAGAGLLNGSTSIPGPVLALYLAGLRLDRRAFVYGITLLFAVGNVVQVVSYAKLGLYASALLPGALVLTPAGLAGQQLGFWIHDRLRPALFRRLVLIAVMLAGGSLVVRGLAA